MAFRWNEWNLCHATKHGVEPEEAEWVVGRARPPFPKYRGDGRWMVWGQGEGGRYLQVVFLLDEDGAIYIIHARPLADHEKRQFRRRAAR